MVLRLRKLVDKMTSRELERWKLVLTDWRHPLFFFLRHICRNGMLWDFRFLLR